MTFEYTDPTGERLFFRPAVVNAHQPTNAIAMETEDGRPVYFAVDQLEDVIAGMRDIRRQAARTASGQQPETVPTPEEGIEDARKVIQHVLQLFLDRVPRNELDAETMADSVTDALSDGLTELYRSLAQAETALAAVGQPAEAQATEKTRVRWGVESRYPNGGTFSLPAVDDRTSAEKYLEAARESSPEATHRLVRETTTWTVEDETAPASEAVTESLVRVGWWCWRGDNHGHLADIPCRSDNVPIHVPAEWADEMRAVIQHLTDDHEPGEDCTWVTPEEQAAETQAAADTVEDETR